MVSKTRLYSWKIHSPSVIARASGTATRATWSEPFKNSQHVEQVKTSETDLGSSGQRKGWRLTGSLHHGVADQAHKSNGGDVDEVHLVGNGLGWNLIRGKMYDSEYSNKMFG